MVRLVKSHFTHVQLRPYKQTYQAPSNRLPLHRLFWTDSLVLRIQLRLPLHHYSYLFSSVVLPYFLWHLVQHAILKIYTQTENWSDGGDAVSRALPFLKQCLTKSSGFPPLPSFRIVHTRWHSSVSVASSYRELQLLYLIKKKKKTKLDHCLNSQIYLKVLFSLSYTNYGVSFSSWLHSFIFFSDIFAS